MSILSEIAQNHSGDLKTGITNKINELILDRENVPNDMIEAVLESHRVLCEVKNMGENEAFGHNPAIFYSLGLLSELGELAKQLIRVLRSWGSKEEEKNALELEIADVFIYAILLAHTNGIDINKLVVEKAAIVCERAKNGYYGGKMRE
jgi:NTP pyrophosphatase (non-canonical NTP hydrolase)